MIPEAVFLDNFLKWREMGFVSWIYGSLKIGSVGRWGLLEFL